MILDIWKEDYSMEMCCEINQYSWNDERFYYRKRSDKKHIYSVPMNNEINIQVYDDTYKNPIYSWIYDKDE